MLVKTLTLAALGLALGSTSALPTSKTEKRNTNSGSYITEAPLSDGYPNYTPDQLQQLYLHAGGSLSNSTPPANVSDFAVTFFTAVAHLEYMEAVLFRDFLSNVTNCVPGFEIPSGLPFSKDYIVEAFTKIQAQEELHHLTANGVVKAFGPTGQGITGCTRYNFPIWDFASGIEFFDAITSNVYGGLGAGAEGLGINNDTGLIRPIVATATQEGTQGGFFKLLKNKGLPPSDVPFETVSNLPITWSAFSQIVDPTSCANYTNVQTTVFAPLTAVDSTTYTIPASSYKNGTDYYLTFINQLNTPFSVPATVDSSSGSDITLHGDWLYDEHLLNGLTIVLLTTSAGPFADVDAASAAATHGPVFRIIN